MGLFKNLKSALGIGLGSLELEAGPRAHLGENQTGVVRFTANKDINVYEIGVRLVHRFHAEHRLDQMIMDEQLLVERAAFAESDSLARDFELTLPWETAPSAPGFSWHIEAWLNAEGQDPVSKRVEVMVDMSVVGGAIHHVLISQFGFSAIGWDATEDGLVVNYKPDASVRRQFQSLEVVYDENERELSVGFRLQNFSRNVLGRYADQYDAAANVVWLSLRRSEFDTSKADYQAVYAEIQPLFELE